MSTRRFAQFACSVALLVLVAFVVYINVDGLTEAFGSVPPHYSRTTNMDKWTDPLPVLFLLDTISLAAVAGYLWWALRKRPV